MILASDLEEDGEEDSGEVGLSRLSCDGWISRHCSGGSVHESLMSGGEMGWRLQPVVMVTVGWSLVSSASPMSRQDTTDSGTTRSTGQPRRHTSVVQAELGLGLFVCVMNCMCPEDARMMAWLCRVEKRGVGWTRGKCNFKH